MEQTFKYLTTRELIYRKFIDLFGPLFASKVELSAIIVPGYSLLKNLTALSSGTSALIGIFMKNDTKAKVFIKKYVFQIKGLRYASLINELGVLQLLSRKELTRIPEYNLVIPALKRAIHKNNEITMICEYKEGELLYHQNENTKIATLYKVFDGMQYINRSVEQDIRSLPKRNFHVLAITFLYFWIKLCIKTPELLVRNGKLLVNFYKYYVLTLRAKNTYGLVHRDLHSRNILLDNNDIIITDWEGTVITDSLYDIAMISRLYMNEISIEKIVTFLKHYIDSKEKARRFLFSAFFYTVQTLGLDEKGAKSYQDAENYIELLEKHIKPNLLSTN